MLDQALEGLDPRLRRQRGRLAFGAHHLEQTAHLRQRLATRLLDDRECLPLALLLRLQQAAHGSGLHRHHADRVCDHVVQLARDAGPLLLDRIARLHFALASGLLERGRLREPPVERVPGDPGRTEEEPGEEVVAHRALRVVARDDGTDGEQDQQAQQRLAAVVEEGQEERARQHGEEGDERVRHRLPLEERDHAGGDENERRCAERKPPPREQRQRHQQHHRDEQPERTVDAVDVAACRHDLDRAADRAEHDQGVEEVAPCQQRKRFAHAETVLHRTERSRPPL